MIILVIFLILLVAAGVFLMWRAGGEEPPVGSFIINETDPGTDFISLDFDVDLPELKEKEYIRFKVVRK